MTGIGARFDIFLKNIQLNSDHIQDAKTKYDGVCKKLHDNYYYFGYTGDSKVLIGSYGKKNAIAPPTDIDLIFKVPGDRYQKYNDYKGNGQSQLLQDVRSILLEKYPNTSIHGDRNVVAVDFRSYSIEVVPGFILKNGNYYIPDSYGNGTWKISSPTSEKELITASNKKTNGNTIKLIKIMKAWKNNSTVPIKSVIIELAAISFLNQWKYANSTFSSYMYDWMVRDFIEYLIQNQNNSISMAGTGELINFGNKWVSKAQSAHSHAIKACDYESKNMAYLSSTEWQKVFGDRFPYKSS